MEKKEEPGFFARILERIPERTVGLRTVAAFETLLFLSICTLLNYVLGDGGRFVDFFPHPYWIIILLMAAQYGTNEALIASILGSIALLAWNLPEQAMDDSTFDYIFGISFRPLMWIIASVVIGELRVRHIQRYEALQSNFNETQKREKSITRAYEQLRGVKEGLETRIAGHLQGTVALYQSLKMIEGLSPVQVLMGVSEMVGNVIHPEKFSAFSFGPNGFEVITSIGWADGDKFSRRISSDSVLYQELMNSRRIICSVNKKDAEILDSEGILAGPLIDPQTGQVFGMLKIEYLDFIDLTVTNVETFKILCEWAGSAYSQARQFQETLADAMHNLETGMLSKQFGKFARQILEYMKKEQGVQTTTIEMVLIPSQRQTPQEKAKMAQQFYQLIQDQLPANALICDGRRRNSQFVLFLPGTDLQQSELLILKLEAWKNGIKDDYLSSIELKLKVKEVG